MIVTIRKQPGDLLGKLLAIILLSSCSLGIDTAVAGEKARDNWTAHTARVIAAQTPTLMRKLHVPGVSIALVEGGRVSWVGAYGSANARTKRRVDTNTLFEAASMSKPLFTYATLKLVEGGVMDLDRPLVEYLDEPYLPDQPKHRLITARMVMNHTSGFPNWRPNGWLGGKPLKIRFEPGSRHGYSGEGFLYLQRVVEHITGKPLQTFMRKKLLEPIGMTSSSYR